jgi:hypothetical protein
MTYRLTFVSTSSFVSTWHPKKDVNFLEFLAGGDEVLSLLELLFLGERLRLRELLGPAVTELFEVFKLLDLEEALELDELFELVKLGDSTGLVYPLCELVD